VVRWILGGTVVRVRVDRKSTSISLLIVLGVRRNGQKVLLANGSMGGGSEAARRTVLDDLVASGSKRPELAIVDGAPGLKKALAACGPISSFSGALCISCCACAQAARRGGCV
jgi:putative transposase